MDSNDVLYGADPDYLGEIQAIINKVLDDILEEIAKLKSEEAESSEAVWKNRITSVMNIRLQNKENWLLTYSITHFLLQNLLQNLLR